MKKLLPTFLALFSFISSNASHLVGGNISYRHLNGDTYEITVTYYRDCRPPSEGGGNPQAILSDVPLFLSVFDGNSQFIKFDSIPPSSQEVLAPILDSSFCIEQPLDCFNKITFITTRNLPSNSSGYYIVAQRCCWIGAFENLDQSSANGMNTMVYIPPNNLLGSNKSAIFNADLNKIFCVNSRGFLDCSAVDVDGDSLSYELCYLNSGASNQNPKPILLNGPPFPMLKYASGYSWDYPMQNANTNFKLDSVTGILSFTPSKQGSYHVGVCCREWRNGNLIQTNERNVIVRIIDCKSELKLTISEGFITPFNCPKMVTVEGADQYKWSILPANQDVITLDNDTIPNPSIQFNQNATVKSGTFTLKVIGTNNQGCIAEEEVVVHITPEAFFIFPNAFSPNGDGLNDVFSFINSGQDFESIRIFNRWGNMVFESNSINNKWDGKYNGKDAAADTYVWVAQIRDKQGNKITKKGTVLIVR